MAFELIAVFVAGFGAAGLALLLNRLSGRRLPRWTVPAAAAAGMLAVAIANEYDWFRRSAAALPPQFEVVIEVREPSLLRPWTYAVPLTTRFAALDRGSIRRHPASGQVVAELWLFARWQTPARLTVAFDCRAHARAELTGEPAFGPDGALQALAWMPLAADDPMLRTACEGG